MKTFLAFLLAVCLVASAQAQAPIAQSAAPLLAPDKLDQLLGPIALYPDSLVALILPASTVPSDIVLAARYLGANGDPAQVQSQPWDDSVKALTRYPDLLQWLSQNLDWTTQLGDAFVSQPANVMDAIQQLRAQAKAAGNLVNTAQQEVVMDDGDIDIQPTNPDVIYVPQYDADSVYDEGYSSGADPLIVFGAAYPVGAWLNYGVDWHRRGVYVGDSRRGSGYRGHGSRDANITNALPWQPNPNRVQREGRNTNQGSRALSRPQPLPGVNIPHRTRAAGNIPGNALPATGNRSSFPSRDFTGRGVSRPAVPAVQNTQHTPAAVFNQPTQQGSNMLNDYRRGSNAREASVRGQGSRQPSVAPSINKPSAAPRPAAVAPRPAAVAPRPVAVAPRPAAVAPRPAAVAPRPAAVAPRPAAVAPRPAAVAPRPAAVAPRPAPAASAFRVSPGPAANASSAQGAKSRDRR